MSVTLHTVGGGTVSAVDDARLYDALSGKISGLVDGGAVTIVSGLNVHITSGWGIIMGRVFTITADDIAVTPASSGTQEGRLKLVIDLSDPDNPISIVSEARVTLPALTQEDINGSGTTYEYALATYDVTPLAVSNLTSNTEKLIGIPPTRTVNGHALTSDVTVTASDVGAVPTTRTVNSKALSSNITIGRDDISGIVKSNTSSSKTLTMSLSGTTLTITYN